MSLFEGALSSPASFIALATLVVACGGNGSVSSAPGSSGSSALGGTAGVDAGASGGGSGTTGLGTGGMLGAGGGIFMTGDGFDSGALSDANACVAEVEQGEAVPLDMYMLLDKSSSMADMTSTGATKWDAIRSAITAFVQNSGSNGIGVGLQYFPLLKQGVPQTCTANNQCGSGGPCFLKACDTESTLVNCTTDADCDNVRGACVEFGVCEYTDPNGDPVFCAPIGENCNPGYGQCLDIQDRWCLNGTDCSAATYATPAVAIAELPGAAAGIVASLNRTTPDGQTPTAPALQGAIDQASTYAKANPGHKVVAVLATDGLPTECTPIDIGPVSQIATAGLNGNPSIPTFVIGVFAPTDTDSPMNLDDIAKAGGTDHAYVVDTSGNVTNEFLTALDSISGSKLLSCELKLPAPQAGQTLDYFHVNLELDDSTGGKKVLTYVGSADKCAAAPGTGWYYDNDPSSGASPTKIVVCSDVCSSFQSAPSESISLHVGCQRTVSIQ